MTASKTNMSKQQIARELRNHLSNKYPSAEGWTVYNRFNWVPGVHDFVIQREHNGQMERVVVEVNLTEELSQSHVERFREMTKRLSSEHSVVFNTYLVISDEVRASQPATSEDFELLTFESFFNQNTFGNSGHSSMLAA